MAGLKPVMRSHCRVWLLRETLSLYSSETDMEGLSVTGPRSAGGARSPTARAGTPRVAGRGCQELGAAQRQARWPVARAPRSRFLAPRVGRQQTEGNPNDRSPPAARRPKPPKAHRPWWSLRAWSPLKTTARSHAPHRKRQSIGGITVSPGCFVGYLLEFEDIPLDHQG